MSLVNDMLKELEQRQPIQEGDGYCGESNDSPEYDLYEKGSKAKLGRFAPVVLVLMFGCSLVLAFWLGSSGQNILPFLTTDNHKMIEKPVMVQSLAISPASQPFKSTESKTLIASPELGLSQQILPRLDPKTTTLSTELRIDQLLAEAEEAYQGDKLTEPADDNALSRYQSILQIDPSHEKALTGIKAIVSRYLALSGIGLERGDEKLATVYQTKAQQVVDQYPSMELWYLSQSVPVPSNTLLNTHSKDLSDGHSKENLKNNLKEGVHSDSQTQENAEKYSITEPQFSVRPSQKSLDRKYGREADELISQNRLSEAYEYLRKIISDNPNVPLCQERLFEVLLLQNKPTLAKTQLEKLGHLPGYQRAYFSAKLEVSASHWQAAAKHLESFTPDVGSASHYYALLGAIYHQLSRHQDSIAVYRRLLTIDNRQSTYWLGLAISSDALGESSVALQAFQFARQYGGLDSNTFSYVEKRIGDLSQVAAG